ncbi:hypothetical protein [Aromatoleum buckelii]|uniref:GIY-YIG domain-containing protein n=1 Tax=Aromatoleum buckelii TaxID=200254 RepID=A0ABX1N1V7_9RHOO|nr:hypothetical protein [Aromatoleum buckelii]MCK0510918.1 hypothetical protein [Aromatoleum buckelii]
MKRSSGNSQRRLTYLEKLKAGRVYVIICRKNGKTWVGKEGPKGNRPSQHYYALRQGRHPTQRMQDDWNRYGAEQFVFAYVLRIGERRIDASAEDDCIELLRAHEPKYGYNRMLRGEWTAEARRDEAERRRKNKWKPPEPDEDKESDSIPDDVET